MYNVFAPELTIWSIACIAKFHVMNSPVVNLVRVSGTDRFQASEGGAHT
jgi:hypothetical protein